MQDKLININWFDLECLVNESHIYLSIGFCHLDIVFKPSVLYSDAQCHWHHFFYASGGGWIGDIISQGHKISLL